jgi:ABC-type phosphate transport system substrate-binding protein
MDISVLQKRIAFGPLAVVAVGLALLGGLVFVDTSSATVPPGVACQPTDGKITGRGATYQNGAEVQLASAYSENYCGNVAEQFAGDPAGSDMVIWNDPAVEAANFTSSSQGLLAASCRTDAYAGSSSPYTQAQLLLLNGAPGALEGTSKCSLGSVSQPYQPAKEGSGEYPTATDTTAPIMTLPIAGSSVGLAVNLSGSCSGGIPTALNFTPEEVSRIFGGDALTWNDAELVGTDPALSSDGCTGAITRVVRAESAASTTILKSYLERVDTERTGSACAPPPNKGWAKFPKTEWPGLQHVGSEGTCSTIVKTSATGNGPEIELVSSTNGSIGYADLAAALAAENPNVILANVQNATNTGFQSPGSSVPNCNFNLVTLPGSSARDSVGLNTTDDWSTNNQEVNSGKSNHENATDLGSKYPICGLAFDLVYTGLSKSNSSGHSAITPLTDDQRRTLYSYFTFVLSSTGQETLSQAAYQPLPTAWLSKLTSGFQANF